jgi:hypothetical protein
MASPYFKILREFGSTLIESSYNVFHVLLDDCDVRMHFTL